MSYYAKWKYRKHGREQERCSRPYATAVEAWDSIFRFMEVIDQFPEIQVIDFDVYECEEQYEVEGLDHVIDEVPVGCELN